MNMPNKLTLTRIVLAMVFMTFFLSENPYSRIFGCILYFIAALTDIADGHYARKYGIVTGFGKFMDPLADKILVASAFIALVMVALRVPLDQATACITALAVNAAIDFSLYMVADYQTALLSGGSLRQSLHYALPVKGKIIVIDILLNCICFAPLMASRFIPVARMGWIMIVMLLACGFGSLLLLPALLPACTRPTAESD